MLERNDVTELGRSRWAVPIMAALTHTGGERFAVLKKTLQITPSSLSHSLDHLISCGWIVRNTGHGHPLRPEYMLTEAGVKVAKHAKLICAAYSDLGLTPAILKRWSMPVAFELRTEALRFSELQECLVPATPRALSLTVKSMLGTDLISRKVVDAFPPKPLYALTDRGRQLAAAF